MKIEPVVVKLYTKTKYITYFLTQYLQPIQPLWCEAIKFTEITQNNGYYTIRGHRCRLGA